MLTRRQMDLRYVCVFMFGLLYYNTADNDVEFLFDSCQNKSMAKTKDDGKSEQGSEQLIFECLKNKINRYPRDQRQNLLSKLHNYAGFQDVVEKCLDSHLPTTTCDPNSKYRNLDGSCNNLLHPTWGKAGECVQRLLPIYYKGTHDLRQSVKGGPLPPPRDLSAKLCSGQPQLSPVSSFLLPVFGQFVAHEMSFSTPATPKCCPISQKNDPRCDPIIVKPDDPFYGKFNVTCLNQSRTDPCNKCTLGKRRQTTQITASIDASIVYSTKIEELNKLRTWDGTGRLITDNNLLPANQDPKKPVCPKDETNKCFEAGDVRVNQNTGLMSFHTIFMREHNRIVTKLKLLNPHWKEEQLFQEGRKILGGIFQAIIYQDLLPPILGPETMSSYNLSVREDGLGTVYFPTVRLGTFAECNTAAYRLHSTVGHWPGFGGPFKDLISNWRILRAGNLTDFLDGMRSTPSGEFTKNLVSDLNKYFKQKPGEDYGDDLASIDIARGRDHGLPPYIKILEYCSKGQLTVNSFDDLIVVMSPHNIQLLKDSYADVRDIDAWLGMMMEKRIPGSLIGPIASCVIGKQFHSIKYGDRFFFEHVGEIPSFTTNQRETLKNASLSRVLCDNTESTEVQPKALLLPGKNNPIISCDFIPEVDLSLWKE